MAFNTRTLSLLCVLILFGGASRAGADLIDLQDGTIYSTDLQMAFLKDMNTALTTGHDSDGIMSWLDAMAWINHLNAIGHLGYTDWELASGSGVGSSQFPLRTQANYLEHIFYDELANERPSGWGTAPEDFIVGPFVNLGTSVAAGYWVFPELIDNSCLTDGSNCYAAAYRIFEDRYDGVPWGNYATAMRHTSVPEPSTLLLLGTAAVGWVLRGRIKRFE